MFLSAGSRKAKFTHKIREKVSYFEVLDVLFGELKCSSAE
jgi:hypothetical protein